MENATPWTDPDLQVGRPAAGPNLSFWIIVLVSILVGIGILEIYAASSMKAAQQFNDSLFFVRKQIFAALVGFGLCFVIQRIPMAWIERLILPLFLFSLVLLALIVVPGAYAKVGGAKRWLNLPGLSLQPVEIAKIALILFLAKSLSRETSHIESFFRGIVPNLLPFALFAPLIMLQPDFGSTVLLACITFVMLFAAGLPYRYVFLSAGAGCVALVSAIVVAPYRLARLTTFLDPWAHAQSGGFQIIQSYLAFQNGGFFGVGLGESKQKLFFLPEAHTDFILPVIGEELGFAGVACVWAAYVGLVIIGFRLAKHLESDYNKFLALGCSSAIALQALMNMGVTMGLLPTKGIPLPFVSSGRSSLLCFFVLAGILMKLAKELPNHDHETAATNPIPP